MSAEPADGDAEPVAPDELSVEPPCLSQRAGRNYVHRNRGSEGHRPSARGAPGAVDERGRRLLPPVEHSIGEPVAHLEQRVASRSGTIDATSVDAIIEAESVEGLLTREVKRSALHLELDQVQIAITVAEQPPREALTRGSDSLVGRVTDPESARGRVEPMTGRGESLPPPLVRRFDVDAPPPPRCSYCSQARRTNSRESAQDWSPAMWISPTPDSTSPSANRPASVPPPR